jgi:CheY-like chemotaxis protein
MEEEMVNDLEPEVRSAASVSGTILLVDDEEYIRVTGSQMLEELGYSVRCASNGKEAVDLFRGHKDSIDLVILDVIMPEMSGIEAFHQLKRINENCPVILCSGFTRDEDLVDLKNAGLFGIIRKPFDLSVLKREIDMALYKDN